MCGTEPAERRNVNSTEHLKLVVLYDANENECTISAHNLSDEEAAQVVAKWNPHFKPGYSLITLDQRKRHRTEDAALCRACRETVARSAHISPKPKFKRTKKEDQQ